MKKIVLLSMMALLMGMIGCAAKSDNEQTNHEIESVVEEMDAPNN